MKAIFALLFSYALSAACTPTDGTGAFDKDSKCTCGSLETDKCGDGVEATAKVTCLKSGNVDICDTTDNILKVALCKDAEEATKNCTCAKAAVTDIADVKMCKTGETCTTADGKCAAKSGNSATMITAFATIMTTAFFSF